MAQKQQSHHPGRNQSSGPAAAKASQQVSEAERNAETAAEVAGEASLEARQAELGATLAAEMAIAAAHDAESGQEAGFPRLMMLTPSPELRSLIESIVAGIQGAGYGTPPTGPALSADQQSLALKYDAFRTMLGRHGAASIALYRIVDEDYIEFDQLLGERSSVVVYGRPADDLGQPIVAIGRAPCEDGRAHIPNLRDNVHIDRVEILDADKQPVLFGRPDGRVRPGYEPYLERE